jgi:hypothetical protein
VTIPWLGSLRGEDEGVEGFRAERLVRFGRWGAVASAHELIRAGSGNGTRFFCLERTREAGAKWWRRRRHGALVALLDLIGETTAGVQTPRHGHMAVSTKPGR